MPVKRLYLTIDDAPSKHMKAKVDFLVENNIPAVFYCRGKSMLSHMDHVVDAIQRGFLIGNHSFTHPYFSQIPLNQCYEEILKTEELIEVCYEKSGLPRPCKVMRFPFGDRGDGEKIEALQSFLKEQGFVGLFGDYIDAFWDWDTQDYKDKFIADGDAYEQALSKYWEDLTKEDPILLLHDFDPNHHLFDRTMAFLLSPIQV